MIAGRDSDAEGEAKNSWLTGTASWNYVAITQAILGIRPSYAGLEIHPVIPTSWNGFDAKRLYRGVRYFIHVERRGTGNNVRHEVDGKPIEGMMIPLPPPGTKEVHVNTRVF
jgi:cellobiose phosphorylase